MYQYDPVELALIERSCIPQAVYQFVDGHIAVVALSKGFCRLFGYGEPGEAARELERDTYRDAHPDDAARMANAGYRFAVEGGDYDVVYRTRLRGEAIYSIVHAHGQHIYTDSGERLAMIWYTDEGRYVGDEGSERGLNALLSKALQTESRFQTGFYDTLTGLANMSGFIAFANTARRQLLAEGKSPAVLYIDLNGMKVFNEKYGFSEGDKLIRRLGGTLARQFGSDNCGRLGQDHFGVLTEREALEERLAELFELWHGDESAPGLSLRVGVYLDEQGAVEIDTACDRAKAASDALRSSLSSCYAYYDDTMQADAERRAYILDNFDRALAERWIQVYYQPIVRSANGRVCDEEALARWIDPVKGMLPPAEFIPILEDARLIYRLDLYMLDRVLEKMRRLRDAGLFIVPASLNLSRSDFECCDIVEEIRRRVDESGLSRDRITIEITESMIGGDFEFMKQQLDRLHALGFPVWMDDFGSEYSSLDYLQSLRFDLLKFDMRFMQQFDQSERSRIILTELVKMAIALGIDTVAEGVETKEQVDFLTEIGCTKLQGFYFCRPIPLEVILERYRSGAQIGFENPEEEAYFSAVGRINLYDLAVIAHEDEASLQHFFNTIPMAIIENSSESFTVLRCNQSYRTFLTRVYGFSAVGEVIPYTMGEGYTGNGFLRALRQCGIDGTRTILDERISDGSTVHAFVKRIAVNPVTGTSAIAVAVLAVFDPKEKAARLDYADIAKALSSDYFNLFYVDLENEVFVEYRNDPKAGDLALERHGSDFFAASRQDARLLLHPDDQEGFIAAFTKEQVLRAIDETGSFVYTYRLSMFGEPVYVSMKAVRPNTDRQHIIIGVCNVDTQTRQKQALERIREEQVSYARIAALSDEFLSFYTVDPETNSYLEYSATALYAGLGIRKEGEDFFAESSLEIPKHIHPDDLPAFRARFSKQAVLSVLENAGRYELRYRLMLGGEAVPVSLKAARVVEKDGVKLIFGLCKIF